MESEISKDHSKNHVDFLEDLFQGCIHARQSNDVNEWFLMLRDISSVLVTEMDKVEKKKSNENIRKFLPRINENKSGSDLEVSIIDTDLFMDLKDWEDSFREIRKKAGLQQAIRKDIKRIA